MATAAPDPIGLQICRWSSESLAEYLGKVVIAAEPQPQAWERLIEPWQSYLRVSGRTAESAVR